MSKIKISIDNRDQVRVLDIEEKRRDIWRNSCENNQPEARTYDWFSQIERGLVYPWLRKGSTNGQ